MSNAAPAPAPVTPDVAAEELRILILSLARRMRIERNDESVSPSQLSVLFLLLFSEPQSPGELAAAEQVTPPSMTRTINSLEERGLVVRTPHGDDARRVEVALTPTGREFIETTRRLRVEWFTRRLERLDAGERAALEAAAPVLRRILEED